MMNRFCIALNRNERTRHFGSPKFTFYQNTKDVHVVVRCYLFWTARGNVTSPYEQSSLMTLIS